MTTPTPQQQRDNLNIGIFLAGRPYGAPLDQILQIVLGYDPNNPVPPIEHYERRFRDAQRIGRDRFRERVPGYFTFNAQPFGQIYVYKVIWYTWLNRQSGTCQIVPILSVDLAAMRRLRDRDIATREATTRSIRAAHNIEEERAAIARQDYQALRAIQARMLEDTSLGEILSGLHGLPYADLENILPQLPNRTFGNNMRFRFQRTAQNINRLQHQLRREQASIARDLSNWVMLKTGLPGNAQELALQDAVARARTLGGP